MCCVAPRSEIGMHDGWLWLVFAVACGTVAGLLMDRYFDAKGK